MDTQQKRAAVGLVLGGVSLVGGCLCRIALSYLPQVPLFRDFSSLRDHVKKAPDQRAQVLVEGRVKRAGLEPGLSNAVISEKTGLTGSAILVTTTETECAKVGEENGECEKTRMDLRPFWLLDAHGCSIEVDIKSVMEAKGLKQLLQMVYEVKPESSGQARSTTRREYLLLFGTPLVGYGEAVWKKHNLGSLLFTPTEVGSSVEELCLPHSKTKAILKYISIILVVVGGTTIIFSVAPLLVRLFRQRFMSQTQEEKKRATITTTKA